MPVRPKETTRAKKAKKVKKNASSARERRRRLGEQYYRSIGASLRRVITMPQRPFIAVSKTQITGIYWPIR
jgi:hypothetical protein